MFIGHILTCMYTEKDMIWQKLKIQNCHDIAISSFVKMFCRQRWKFERIIGLLYRI